MRIAYLSHGSDFKGGAEFCYVETVQTLTQLGHEVYGIFNQPGAIEKVLGKQLQNNLYLPYLRQWVSYPFKRTIKNNWQYSKYWLANLKGHYNGVQAITRFLKEYQIEIAITNTQIIPVLAVAAARVHIPHVWYIHELGDLDHHFVYDFGKHKTFQWIDSYSQVVAYNSQIVKNHLIKQGIQPQKLYEAYYVVQVSPQAKPAVEPSSHTFTFLGRPSPSKGQHIAIKAMAEVVKHEPNAILKIVGVGEDAYSQELKELAQTLQISSHIQFVPFKLHPLQELQGSLALLVCSQIEAFGRVTVEGMKMGVPVIAADTGASPEILENGQLGTLFRYPDHQDLAQKMIALLQNPQDALQKAQQAQRIAEQKYSYKTHAEQWKKIIQAVFA